MVFYRKYRPQTFSDIIGQENVVKTLQNALAADSLSHAYLFCGPKGSGKTSTARILAKAVNCEKLISKSKEKLPGSKPALDPGSSPEQALIGGPRMTVGVDPCNQCASCVAITNGNHMDVIEIDAASNRGIDDIRSLQEKIMLSPVTGVKKVYIIDEVHMLTTEAFNALLKTLEEPPAHVLLILATTEVHKLPVTIISRVTRLNFGLASFDELKQALIPIIKAEKITIDDEAVDVLLQFADGSFRDAEKLLDQMVQNSGQKITADDIRTLFLASSTRQAVAFLHLIADYNETQALAIIRDLVAVGNSVEQFVMTVLHVLRAVGFIQLGQKNNDEAVASLAEKLTRPHVFQLLKLLSTALREQRTSPIGELPLEMAVIEWCLGQPESGIPQQESGVKKQEVRRPENNVILESGISQAIESPTDLAATPEAISQKERLSIQAEDVIAPKEAGAMLAKDSDNIEIALPQETKAALANVAKSAATDKIGAQDVAVSLAVIKAAWPNFLRSILETDHAVALLLKNAKIRDFADQILTLEVLYKFHKERLENDKIRQMTESALAREFNAPIKIVCHFEGKPKAEVSEELSDVALTIFASDIVS